MLAIATIISTLLLTTISAAPLPGGPSNRDPCVNVGYVPVCVSDQFTFYNACYYREAMKTNQELRRANAKPVAGPCNDWPMPSPAPEPVDPCVNVGYAPVCAHQGTFYNRCYFEEAKKTVEELRGADVTVVEGPCNDWPIPTAASH